MGGATDRVQVVPIGDGALHFGRFAVEHAKCFKAEDKAKLLTAIESAFGAYGPFNALVRSLLTSASGGGASGGGTSGGGAMEKKRSPSMKRAQVAPLPEMDGICY